MTEFNLPGLPEVLDDHFCIRFCSSPLDVERVATLNAEVHGSAEGETVRRWLAGGHPQIRPEGWLYVEDETTQEAVATLGLIPLTWRYGPVSLPVAELGFVASLPAYRRRGLQRALSAAFDRIALANGYSLAAIEGIPFFYRQFGYEYALPLCDSRFIFRLDQPQPEDPGGFQFRPAARADVPQLMALFERQNRPLTITTERSEAMWQYYLDLAEAGPPVRAGELSGLRPYLMLREGAVMGYLALAPSGWANRLNIVELAADSRVAVLAALAFARAQAEADGQESVGLQLPASHPACEVARYLGTPEERTYGWQMKVLDPVRFLNAVAPAFEERLACSVLRDANATLDINLCLCRVRLHIEQGRVSAVPLETEAAADVTLLPTVATQLWLGWRSFPALDEWHQDVWARPEKRHLIEVLFPPAQAHIYLGY